MPVEHELFVFERGGKTIGASIQYLATDEKAAIDTALPILLSVKEVAISCWSVPRGTWYAAGMRYLLASTVVMLVMFACGVEEREQVCTPGADVACACAGQSTPGAQTCSDDGEEFGACRCCTFGQTRSCGCSTIGKVGRQDCSRDGQWGGCYACQ